MKRRNCLITIVLFASIVGCSNEKTKTNDFESKLIVSLDVGFADKFSWPKNTVVDDVTFLSTSDTTLISSVGKLVVLGDKIYILDDNSSRIFAFDKSGVALGVLNKKGGAPGEYRDLRDMQINLSKNEIEILDVNTIKKYNLDNFSYKGDAKIIIEPEFIPQKFVNVDDNDTYYVWCSNPVDYQLNNQNFYHLVKYKDGSRDFYLKHMYGSVGGAGDRFHPTYAKGVYNVDPPIGDNNVYRISNDSTLIAYQFKFSSNDIPAENLKTAMRDGQLFLSSPYFKSFQNFLETSEDIYFSFIGEDGKGYSAIYNKANHKVISIGKPNSFQPRIFSCDEKYFYGFIFPADLKLMIKGNMIDTNNNVFLKGLDIAKIDAEDNPIIFKFHLAASDINDK
jgi:hypothetical protein